MPKSQTEIKAELESLLKKATEDNPKKLQKAWKKVEELESAIEANHVIQNKSKSFKAS